MAVAGVRGASSSTAVRAKPSPVGPVNGRRVALATVMLAVVVAGVVGVVRVLGDSGLSGPVLSAVLGLVVLPVVASPLEWFVHRFVYHEAMFGPLVAIFTVHTACSCH